MASVILGYKAESCFGYIKDPGGWSFDIFSRGTIRFKTYLMDGTVMSSVREKLPQQVADDIFLTLQKREKDILRLPKKTDNRSCDGCYHTFTFLGSKIRSLNISKHKDLDNKETEQLFDAEYIHTLRTENQVLEIFGSVSHLLYPYGLEVSFEPSFDCCWKGHTDDL